MTRRMMAAMSLVYLLAAFCVTHAAMYHILPTAVRKGKQYDVRFSFLWSMMTCMSAVWPQK